LGQTAAGTGLSKAQKAALDERLYTDRQINEVITGMILGDANLRIPAQTKDAHLQIQQKDSAFVQGLWDLFDSIGIVGANPRTIIRSDQS
jgi:hypothetical protein